MLINYAWRLDSTDKNLSLAIILSVLCTCLCQSTKLDEMALKVDQLKCSVSDHTTSIDTMRVTRDAKVADIERCQLDVEVSR